MSNCTCYPGDPCACAGVVGVGALSIGAGDANTILGRIADALPFALDDLLKQTVESGRGNPDRFQLLYPEDHVQLGVLALGVTEAEFFRLWEAEYQRVLGIAVNAVWDWALASGFAKTVQDAVQSGALSGESINITDAVVDDFVRAWARQLVLNMPGSAPGTLRFAWDIFHAEWGPWSDFIVQTEQIQIIELEDLNIIGQAPPPPDAEPVIVDVPAPAPDPMLTIVNAVTEQPPPVTVRPDAGDGGGTMGGCPPEGIPWAELLVGVGVGWLARKAF